MSRRIYIGKIPETARTDDVRDHFAHLGPILDCRVMNGFGFIEFESEKDAQEAVDALNGRELQGQPLLVQFAKEGRQKREPPPSYHREERSFRRPPGFGLVVSNVSRDVSWQDLKDFGREAGGRITFADIDRDVPGQGILEYATREDAENAVRVLDGKDLRGVQVRVVLADKPYRGPTDYAPPRDRYYDDRDRYRESRYRSRSPGRRGGGSYYDDRERERDRYRARSPGYGGGGSYGRRSPGYDDRDRDRYRDDRYREERRDRDDRYARY